jgi:thiol:disulfide interchange protein DsbA
LVTITLRILLGVVACLAFSAATAQGTPVAGIDYQEIRPAPSEQTTIEVVEYFWYRCPHCYTLEPLLGPWISRLPAQVSFRRIPAVLGKEWAIDARIFYALEEIGELDRIHPRLLHAIHEKGGRQLDRSAYERWVFDWLRDQGVDLNRYAAALGSSAVHEKVERAAALSRRLKLEGTPTFEVGGRYLISPPLGDRRRILEITDYVVSRMQADKLTRR